MTWSALEPIEEASRPRRRMGLRIPARLRLRHGQAGEDCQKKQSFHLAASLSHRAGNLGCPLLLLLLALAETPPMPHQPKNRQPYPSESGILMVRNRDLRSKGGNGAGRGGEEGEAD